MEWLKTHGGSLLDFAGSLISDRRSRKEARKNRAEARYQFDQQMDHSVRRRMEDAKRAGIHPLFAMGASVGASPTMAHSGSGTTGSAVGDAVSRLGQRLAEAQIRRELAGAKKDESEAQLADSKTATLTSRLASSGRDGVRTYPYPVGDYVDMGMAYGPGWIEEPSFTIASKRPGVEASPPVPVYKEFERADGSTGLAFGAGIPGAEELNAIWIPLQNWWHTSKQARNRLREKLGVTQSVYARLRSDPEYAQAFLRSNARRIKALKRELRAFRTAVSGRPVR